MVESWVNDLVLLLISHMPWVASFAIWKHWICKYIRSPITIAVYVNHSCAFWKSCFSCCQISSHLKCSTLGGHKAKDLYSWSGKTYEGHLTSAWRVGLTACNGHHHFSISLLLVILSDPHKAWWFDLVDHLLWPLFGLLHKVHNSIFFDLFLDFYTRYTILTPFSFAIH